MKGFKRIKKKIEKRYPQVSVEEQKGCIRLSGVLDNWEDVLAAGKIAVCKHSLGVLNDIALKDFTTPPPYIPSVCDSACDGLVTDVLVIGGGVIGCATARELTRWNIDVTLVEKQSDVGLAQSSRNDGQVHVGADLSAKTKKLQYLRRSNFQFDKLSNELDFKFKRVNQYLGFINAGYIFGLPFIKARCRKNGICSAKFLNRKAFFKLQPNANPKIQMGLEFNNGGVVCPYGMTIAYADNAVSNGAKVFLDTAVTGMKVEKGEIVSVDTNRGKIFPKVVINCGGVFSDVIADMALDRTFTIHPRRGTNCILDKHALPRLTQSIIAPYGASTKSDKRLHTKGGGTVVTVDGNVLIGPDALETPLREDFTTNAQSVAGILSKQKVVLPRLEKSDIITYFTGVRAATYEEDFVIRKGIFTKNIVHGAGIQSPGLSAAPAISQDLSQMAVEILKQKQEVAANTNFNPLRKGVTRAKELDESAHDALIKQNPDYGEIICRCEQISKGEILEALRLPLKVFSVDGVKRRARAGMGRCQGGFCQPLVAQIIAKELGVPLTQVAKRGNAAVVKGSNKEND